MYFVLEEQDVIVRVVNKEIVPYENIETDRGRAQVRITTGIKRRSHYIFNMGRQVRFKVLGIKQYPDTDLHRR